MHFLLWSCTNCSLCANHSDTHVKKFEHSACRVAANAEYGLNSPSDWQRAQGSVHAQWPFSPLRPQSLSLHVSFHVNIWASPVKRKNMLQTYIAFKKIGNVMTLNNSDVIIWTLENITHSRGTKLTFSRTLETSNSQENWVSWLYKSTSVNCKIYPNSCQIIDIAHWK